MKNKFNQGKGKAKEVIGNITNNKDLEKKGKKEQATNKVKESVGKAKDKVNIFKK